MANLISFVVSILVLSLTHRWFRHYNRKILLFGIVPGICVGAFGVSHYP